MLLTLLSDPPDDDLRPVLYQWAMEQLSIEEKKARWLKMFGFTIGCDIQKRFRHSQTHLCHRKTKLSSFGKKFNLPSVRKPPPRDFAQQIIMEEADGDASGRRGVEATKTSIRLHAGVLIPRYVMEPR